MPTTVTETADVELEHELLSAVADLEPTIRAAAPYGEEHGRLDPSLVDTLVENGLWRMRLAGVLGGLEAPIGAQFEVIRALAKIDTETAWCTMVANNGVAMIGSYLPQPVIDEVFADGIPRCAIVAGPAGSATPSEGGYRVTAKWRFGSSIRHAKWVFVSTFVDGEPGAPLLLVLPTRDIVIDDNWTVVGLRGTGSCDFGVTDVFVPEHMTARGRMGEKALRGIRHYDREDFELLEAYEHVAIAVGIAQRALAEVGASLATRRGMVVAADREIVQIDFAELTLRLEGVLLTAKALYAKCDAMLLDDTLRLDPADRSKGRALGVWATDLAVECANFAFRRAGASALYTPNVFEKLLRDAHSTRVHFVVNDSALAAHGAALIAHG